MQESQNGEIGCKGVHDLALCYQTFLRPYDTTHHFGKKTEKLWHSRIPFSVLSTPYLANGNGIVNGDGPQFASVVPGVPPR